MGKLVNLTAAMSAALAMSAVANAADLPPAYERGPAYGPVFSWTGFYLGGNLGGAWGRRDLDEARFGLSFDRSSDGRFIGGGQVGYNYQMGSFLLGVEADFDGIATNNDRPGIIVPGVGTVTVRANDAWMSTVAARFGFTGGNWLFYGKAGGGWISIDDFTVTNLTTGTSATVGTSHTRSGGLVGLGFEYAFGNNWTAKIEYDHLSLGSRNFVVPAGAPFLVGDTFTSHRSVDTLKVGFNYLFNAGGYGGRY
jgi:outer membrane immunogenic protein